MDKELKITLGSLFDGIGGWLIAAKRNGVAPLWASEIEPLPMIVTKHHFPEVDHLGNVKEINGAKIEPVDIITAGSPCQDLSIAGERKGLAGERSGLFSEAIRIVREMQNATNGNHPRFFIWENVPGAFSSNRGRDFKTVIEKITETEIPVPKSGKWAKAGLVRGEGIEVAWRVLDAQYWGVPQRRKRIFLVADFRGERAGKILFERESLQRNFETSERTSQGTTRGFKSGTRVAGFKPRSTGKLNSLGYAEELSPTLTTSNNEAICLGFKGNASIRDSSPIINEMIPTMQTKSQMCVCLVEPPCIAYSIAGNTIDRKLDNGGNGKGINKEISFTLNTMDRHAVFSIASYTEYSKAKVAAGIKASGGNYSGGSENLVVTNIVRRLTPLECERLQGLPDNYTNFGSDTARYKAIGNGMAQPCADFVISGCVEVMNND